MDTYGNTIKALTGSSFAREDTLGKKQTKQKKCIYNGANPA